MNIAREVNVMTLRCIIILIVAAQDVASTVSATETLFHHTSFRERTRSGSRNVRRYALGNSGKDETRCFTFAYFCGGCSLKGKICYC
jgi:hypothetical protein